MILRRFTKHVSDQNWFAVGLDIFVVIFGVYIGIFLGEISDERATRSDVNDALQVVRLQLKEDLKTLDGIIGPLSVEGGRPEGGPENPRRDYCLPAGKAAGACPAYALGRQAGD